MHAHVERKGRREGGQEGKELKGGGRIGGSGGENNEKKKRSVYFD